MSIIDFILNLFRDPVAATDYVADPQSSLANAGLSAVSAAQVGAIMPVVAESVASNYGYQSQWVDTGHPFNDLSGNLQNYYAAQPSAPAFLAPSVFSPSPSGNFSPSDNLSGNEFMSHNPIASGNEIASPSGNVDSFNRGPLLDLSFGNMQLGNNTANAYGDHSVAMTGNNSGQIVSGDNSSAVGGNVHGNIVNADHGGSVGLDQSSSYVGGNSTNVSGHGSVNTSVVSDSGNTTNTHISDSGNVDKSTNIGSGNTTSTHTNIGSGNTTDIASHNQTSTHANTSIGSGNTSSTHTNSNIDVASHNQANTSTSHTQAINDSLNSSHSLSNTTAVSNTHSTALNDSLNTSHSTSLNDSMNSSLGSHNTTTGFEQTAHVQDHTSASGHTTLPGAEHH